MSLRASPRHIELHAFFNFDNRKWSASRPGLLLPPQKKQETWKGGGEQQNRSGYLGENKNFLSLSLSLGNQKKFSRSASSLVTTSTELIKLFYLRYILIFVSEILSVLVI